MGRTQKLKGLSAASLILKTFNDNPYSMYKAFRTNTDEISKLENSVKSTDIDKLKSLSKDFKQKIRPFILPKDGVIKGETLKDTYFPTSKYY